MEGTFLTRSVRAVPAALALAVFAGVFPVDVAGAQGSPDSVRVRQGGGRGGNRPPGPPNGANGASPEMFEQYMAQKLRDFVQLSDEQVTKWRAWNKRFDPERRALWTEERESRRALSLQMKPGAVTDDAKAVETLERLQRIEGKWVTLHERENKDLASFLKPTQRVRFYVFQDRVKREFQEMENRRDGDRDGRNKMMGPDSTGGRPGFRGGGPGGRGGRIPPRDTTKPPQ